MPKATTPTSSRQRRHNPLEDDILATGLPKNPAGKKRSKRESDGDKDDGHFIDAKSSRKILSLGRDLLEEEQREGAAPTAASSGGATSSAFDFDPARFGHESDEDAAFDEEEAWGDEEEIIEEIEIDASDLAAFNKFLSPDEKQDPLLKHGWPGQGEDAEEEGQGVNLADLILAKIAEKEAAGQGLPRQEEVGPVDDDFELHPKVIEVYTKIGLILSRYKSGPLPKPFKVLPQIPHWEEIVELTNPDQWTPNACYAATRLWISAKGPAAQRFVSMVLLPRVRDDIRETKKLNVHLFNALKKATFKPAAFFKGFLFELVGSGSCTLREANIIAGVITRTSIPVLHSAAAIKGLCDIAAEQTSDRNESAAATNTLLKALLEKGYALPWQVIDALVFYFLRVRNVISMREAESMGGATAGQSLPVIWHKNLLIFSQRYRNDITEDQREALLDLLNSHGHSAIGPEVRRELLAGRGRGVPLEQQGPDLDGDDTMVVD